MPGMPAAPHVDGFRIVRRIGGRPGCEVFEATMDDGAPVALKLFALRGPAHAGAEALARFRREAQVLRRLAHPGIVRALCCGEDVQQAWLGMELLPGRTLAAAARAASCGQRIAWLLRILDALAHLHAQGLVHRDLKPANIALDAKRGPVLCDFGLVHLADSLLTQRGAMLGSPAYMAPECFGGEAPDVRSDLFSAGVIAYELLTGNLPFRGSNSGEIMLAIVRDEPLPPSHWNAALPRALDAAIVTALAKPPDLRYAGAVDFALALRDALRRTGAD